MKILVNGLCDSAGKTTTTIGLYPHFSELGEVSLFKPFAANDYWYDYPIVSEAVEKDRIHGKDAKLLSELIDFSPREINPIHRLWAPSSVIGEGLDIRREKKSLILDRVWTSEKGLILLKNSKIAVPQELEDLFSFAEEILEFSSVEELNEYMESLHLEAVDKSYEKFKDGDFLITESYSDIAKPGPINFDLVITVEPGRVYLSDGERFDEAYEIISKRWKKHGQEIKTEKVLEMLKPEIIEISPVCSKGETRENYQELFDNLTTKIDLEH